MLYVYRFQWPLHLVWLLVCCLYQDVYLQIWKWMSFWLHGCCGKWEGWVRKPVNHTSWVAVVTPTDRPKSVRNRCVIELFCGVVCVVTLPFWHFCWCRGFYHRTESDLFLFLLIKKHSFSLLWLSASLCKQYLCDISIITLNTTQINAWFDNKIDKSYRMSSPVY